MPLLITDGTTANLELRMQQILVLFFQQKMKDLRFDGNNFRNTRWCSSTSTNNGVYLRWDQARSAGYGYFTLDLSGIKCVQGNVQNFALRGSK